MINKLECPIYPISVNDVVHCEPVKKEYQEIKKIHTDIVVEHPKIDFFSAIDYGKTKLDSETLSHNIATIYGKTVDYSRLVKNVYEGFRNADAILILTEWEEYTSIEWQDISRIMRKPSWLFDTRGLIDGNSVRSVGINFWSVGDGE